MTKKKCQKLQEEKKRQELLQEIERTKRAHADTLLNLENMADPDLIDCYIYELNSVQMRYKFLLARIKKLELG